MRVYPVSNVTGFIFIVLGMVSLIYPAFVSTSLEAFFGTLFLLAGIFNMFCIYETRSRSEFVWNLGLGIIYLLAGIVMLSNPVMGLFAMTWILIMFFFAQGGLQILMSLRQRHVSPKWYWTLIAGLLNLGLSTILYVFFPISAFWSVGVVVGINLLTFGFSILFVNHVVGNE